MKTLYLNDSNENIIVDTEDGFVGKLRGEDRYSIRTIYAIEEPMHVIYQSGETKEELDVKKGDILIRFYGSDKALKTIIAVKSKDWVKNIEYRNALEQKAKEEWAAKNADNCDKPVCCGDCEACSGF